MFLSFIYIVFVLASFNMVDDGLLSMSSLPMFLCISVDLSSFQVRLTKYLDPILS